MKKLKAKYELNKLKNIGEEISCTMCNKKFVKKTKQQVFCGGRGNTRCKDKFWNTVTSNKRNNTTRISPASATWLENNRDRREQYGYDSDFDDDPSWDAHKH